MTGITAPFPTNGQDPWGDTLRTWSQQVEAELVRHDIDMWAAPPYSVGSNGASALDAYLALYTFDRPIVVDKIATWGDNGVDPTLRVVIYDVEDGLAGQLLATCDVDTSATTGNRFDIGDLGSGIELPSAFYAGAYWINGGGSYMAYAFNGYQPGPALLPDATINDTFPAGVAGGAAVVTCLAAELPDATVPADGSVFARTADTMVPALRFHVVG